MKTLQIASFVLVAGLVLASSVHAQTPVEKPADPPKAEAKPEPTKAQPVLSEPEKAAIDVLSLIAQRDEALKQRDQAACALGPLQAQQRDAQLQARIGTLRQVIEGAHPGFRWDVEKGTLVAKAAAKPAPK